MKIQNLALVMGVATIAVGCGGSNASSPGGAAVAPAATPNGYTTGYVPPVTTPNVLPAGAIAVPGAAEVARYSLNTVVNPTSFFTYQRGMFNISNRVDTTSSQGVTCTANTRTIKWIIKTDGQYVYTFEDVTQTGQTVNSQASANTGTMQPMQTQNQGGAGAGAFFQFNFGIGSSMTPMQPMAPMQPMNPMQPMQPMVMASPTPFSIQCVNVSTHTYVVKRSVMPRSFTEMQSIYAADARNSRYFFSTNNLETYSVVHQPGMDAYYLENVDQTNAQSMFVGAQNAQVSITYSIQTSMPMFQYGQPVATATPAPVTLSVTSNEVRESSGVTTLDPNIAAMLQNIEYCKVYSGGSGRSSSSGSSCYTANMQYLLN